jgi:hypothetical protein
MLSAVILSVIMLKIHCAECYIFTFLSCVSVVLSVLFLYYNASVVMLSVIMLNGVMLNVCCTECYISTLLSCVCLLSSVVLLFYYAKCH